MASSSKSSSSKRPLPKPPADATPLPRKKLSVRPVDSLNFDLLHRVSFDNGLRELGKPPTDSDALFLPASAEECSVLVNRWKHLPNTASPAFSLPRYTHLEDVNFREVLEQNTEDIRPDSFYPHQLVTFCSTFSGGPFSRAEGFHLYQAMAFLQQGFARIIRGHLAKTEIHRRLLSFTALPAFSDSLEYYQLYWHNHHNCPLFAPLLVILLCEFCEEHLTAPEYAARVYNTKIRDGPGMSIKTRDRLMEDITELFDLQDLAIPLPLDPSTREGQLVLSVTSQGSRVDRISHPVSKAILRPDPAFQVTVSKPSVAKPRLRPLSPDYDSPGLSKPSRPARRTSRPPRKLPVSSPLIDVDAEEPSSSEVFKGPEVQDVLVLRQSIARAAKSRPRLTEEPPKLPSPSKRERSPQELPPDATFPEPPPKKRRTQKASGRVLADSLVPTPEEASTKDEEPLRIQEGEPEYRDGDDSKTSGHQQFLTNPNFKPKAPFSQLIRKTIAQNPRAPKLPFLRRPKWKLSEEMKNFGAFINSADTSFSLQGLSRYNYLASRPLQSSTSSTLPSPDALHSSTNCLTCLTRGVVCEGGTKIGGPCGHCDRTHRNCPSCLGLDEHRDRFLAIHKAVQGYPVGYSGSLDRFRDTLDEMGHVTLRHYAKLSSNKSVGK